MRDAELQRWAHRFDILRGELRAGTGSAEQLLAAQLAAFREFIDTPPWAALPHLPPPITDRADAVGAEHLLLACHYLLALPAVVAAAADAPAARTALSELLARLSELAADWARDGVDEERARALAARNHDLHHAVPRA
ncbi:hypothetical protein [Nocardia asteroides]|uniref:hypothetical protein n=1 Tax=Nocardia asteroides TaxID=1824 RepID=UPI001E4452B2|nr:hypothetical protein [Nocardia asteroides]UGT61762.1 hypothetical protein LTT61_32450 [Nocardia asteroides]